MTRFYVYIDKQTDTCYYVEEKALEKFAVEQYASSKLDFSGVLIEAESADDAHEAYHTFSGNISWSEEPQQTARFKDNEDASVVSAIATKIYKDLRYVISDMLLLAAIGSKYNGKTMRETYERIRDQIICTIKGYNPRIDDDGEAPGEKVSSGDFGGT